MWAVSVYRRCLCKYRMYMWPRMRKGTICHTWSFYAMATGTAAWMAVSLKNIIKQSYRLERTFLWLGWHWKGAKKQKKLETVISTSSGCGHTSCDFVHKWSYVWYMEMLTRQWLSTIKRVFSAQCFARGTRVPGCTCTTEQRILFLKVPLQSPKPELSLGVKKWKSVNSGGWSLFSCAVTL